MSKRTQAAYKEFLQEHEREEQQKEFERTAPLRAQQQRLLDTASQLARAERALIQREIFAKPSAHLTSACTRYDHSRNLTVEQVTVAVGEAVAALKLFLDETEGIEVMPSGLQKLGRVVTVNGELDTTSVENLKTIWNYLDSNGCLSVSDFKIVRTIVPAAEEVEAPGVRDSKDIARDIENQETTTREGAQRGRRLVVEQIVAESQPLFREFIQHVESHFDIAVTQQQKDACLAYALKHNFNLLSRETWDKCRVNVLNCLTPEEIKDRQMVEDSEILPPRDFAKRYGLHLQANQGY